MYLNEILLGEYLTQIFPNHRFIHNRAVPKSGIINRPDYRCDELMLIIEFDGASHYNKVDVILKDRLKDETYVSMGYNIVRIPYFVQMSSIVINELFGVSMHWEQIYDHGFIDDKALLPANYCELGRILFEQDLKRFHYIEKEIKKSLADKVTVLGNRDLVVPPSFNL